MILKQLKSSLTNVILMFAFFTLLNVYFTAFCFTHSISELEKKLYVYNKIKTLLTKNELL